MSYLENRTQISENLPQIFYILQRSSSAFRLLTLLQAIWILRTWQADPSQTDLLHDAAGGNGPQGRSRDAYPEKRRRYCATKLSDVHQQQLSLSSAATSHRFSNVTFCSSGPIFIRSVGWLGRAIAIVIRNTVWNSDVFLGFRFGQVAAPYGQRIRSLWRWRWSVDAWAGRLLC